MSEYTAVHTRYVLIVRQVVKVLFSSLTQHYGQHWTIKIEGGGNNTWSIYFQQNDGNNQKLAGESFSISPIEGK